MVMTGGTPRPSRLLAAAALAFAGCGGSSVAIVCAEASTGPRHVGRVAVPGVSGEDMLTAYETLQGAGLRVSIPGLATIAPSTSFAGTTTPAAGRLVPRNTTVTIRAKQVFLGVASPAVPFPLPSAVVPNFSGAHVSAAAAWAESHDLFWVATLPPLIAGDAATLLANYRVVKQAPRAGATLELGIGTTTGSGGSFDPTPLRLNGAG
jgi:hypothetical protein